MNPRLTRADAARQILAGRTLSPVKNEVCAFAPANIALVKYWGKRNEELNLPVTSSLSVTLGQFGTTTELQPCGSADRVELNGRLMQPEDKFAVGVSRFLDLFRSRDQHFHVRTSNSVPTAAGLASSASGFAALTLALDNLCGWHLSTRALSLLARMGSGSASRSIPHGFAIWHAGVSEDGMDSFAEEFPYPWPDFRIGLLILSAAEKTASSREAMRRTSETSQLYTSWPAKVTGDLVTMKKAISERDFETLGRTAESNALAMHATGLDAWPPVLFWMPETVATLRRVWDVRAQGIQVYATMDAGPNVKLLFPARQETEVARLFPTLQVITPFQT